MPISKENRRRYPREWPLISLSIRHHAGWRCQWCEAKNGKPHPVTGSIVVLTVAHINNPAPERIEPDNLRALCQRCHLNHDRKQHTAVQAANRRARLRTIELFMEIPDA
jgi:5-methylcytosine-specific restriction endonuclease McrA